MSQAKTTALVLGSGMAGILAARVLSDSFSEVVMIDRRPIDPGSGTFSAGVPQADHLHVLLKRGQLVLERLFPGVLAELAAGGGPTNDWGNTTFWANPYGVHPVHPTEMTTLQFSREALDAAVLARVAARGNVRAVSARVAGLLGEASTGRILGVALGSRGQGEALATELRADLVVDCRGRGSPIVDDGARLPGARGVAGRQRDGLLELLVPRPAHAAVGAGLHPGSPRADQPRRRGLSHRAGPPGGDADRHRRRSAQRTARRVPRVRRERTPGARRPAG
jgi:2-polyprenyl-6-methoxyphenol hydroxylase-like FAD-dependent oxidoreductase